MRPPSRHAKFFSSLKQVEKRLQSEPPQSPNQSSPSKSTDDLDSPLYLNFHSNHTCSSSSFSSIHPPREFFSESPNSVQITAQEKPSKREESGGDDVEELIGVLGLMELKGNYYGELMRRGEDGFYGKIVGAKGPKCEKEVKRLDGWIEHLLRERREGLRIGHLLLCKAASLAVGGLGEIEFPSTVQEFLEHDPPT
ncbi:hypothetical protein Scep_027703 [Stephania cephalantha]|uniref:Uncharacterized protein n=1 Tax=Stephania cephalantha TaxID=152367 RepID=A0AAP0HLC7_9MAGN